MFAIGSHRPSRLSCIFGLGAALVLAGSALTAPAPARASGVDSLWLQPAWNTPAVAGLPFQFAAIIWLPGPEPSRDVCSTDTIHFSYTDALTTLPADYAFDTSQFQCEISGGDSGLHEFTIIPIHAGTQTLTVTDVSFPSATPGTLTFTVAPGPAASLTVSDMPVAAVQDAATPFRVTLKDAWGNVATGYTGTVGFESTDPVAGLPGSYTFNAGDAGTRLFTVYFSKTVIGIEYVTATDTVHTSLTDDGWTNVGPAPHFGFQCSDQTAGVEASCLVTAQNADGTTFTGYRGTVYFRSSDPLAELPINYTFNSTDNGWRTFAPTFKTAGVQTLTATDKDNPGITGTGSLNVLGGDTVGVSIVGLPSAMTAGQVSFTVRTTDAYGNWGSSGTIHFTSSDSKAVLPADFGFFPLAYGTHQFTVTLESPGTVTLTVSGSNWLGSFSASASTIVTPGAATHLSVSGILNP